jgi:sugar lactone lactonase YvrE
MRKILALSMTALTLVLGLAAPAAAAPTKVILLPGATSAEGITAGDGGTFYAADLFQGDIYRGNIHQGTAELFIHQSTRTEIDGVALDERDGLLFAAGGTSGNGYVYDIRTRERIATYHFGDASQINGVIMTPFGVWFDDSLQPKLYFVPVVLGIRGPVHTLHLSGPAAGAPGTFTINDVASTPSGDTLFVAPFGSGTLCTINPVTGASRVVSGVEFTAADGPADGLLLDGNQLWATQFGNRISRWQLSDHFGHGTLEKVITDPLFHAPLTSVKFGDQLAVVNSHLDTAFPPNSPTYEVLVLHD